MLYTSLIHPHLLYCNFILDGASATEKRKLQVQQNSALRAVCIVDYMYPTAKLHTDVGMDNVSSSMMKTTCKLVYRGLNNMGTVSLNEMFTFHCPVRELRSSSVLTCETKRCRMQLGTKNVGVRGATYWNMLPYYIKSSSSVDSSKENIRKYVGFD